METFGNFSKHVQSWYWLCRSNEVAEGRPKSFSFLDRRLVAFRTSDNQLQIFDARCPHMGADLAHGECERETIQCALHRWCFDRHGKMDSHSAAPNQDPQRSLQKYPCVEYFGYVFVFNGERALFEFPKFPTSKGHYAIKFKGPKLLCHPHIAVSNGLDMSHFSHLHALKLTEVPKVQTLSHFQMSAQFCLRPLSKVLQFLTGSRQKDIVANFFGMGGNIAWSHTSSPLAYSIFICNTPHSSTPSCSSHGFLFVPKGTSLTGFVKIWILLRHVFKDDNRILQNFVMHKGQTEDDHCVDTWISLVNKMPTR